MGKKIVIVEDDERLRDSLAEFLNKNGYNTIKIEDFTDTAGSILASGADLCLLDMSLPVADGDYVLRKLRSETSLPVIMLTSHDNEMDELICMSIGADDYVTKPFNPQILLLRVAAILKRTQPEQAETVIRSGGISLDIGRGTISYDGKTEELSANESKILMFMLKNRGRIVTRDELISFLWDAEEFVDDNTLTVNMTRVRQKLAALGLSDVIATKRGQGYMMVEDK